MATDEGAMRSIEEIRQSFSRVPINGHLGLELIECSPERSVVELPIRTEHTQETGVVHGGLISTLADTAAVYLFAPGLPADRTMTSIEFKLNFLAPARADAGPLTARASVVRAGQRICVAEVSVTQAETLVAKGLYTYLVFDRGA